MTILAMEPNLACVAVITNGMEGDYRNGFMATGPIPRLPSPWDEWETMLDSVLKANSQLGDKNDQTRTERDASSRWRDGVRKAG